MASSVARSQVSAATHELLTAVGNNPINKLLKLARKGEINDQVIASCWEGFGSYVARLLRAGKGVNVPKFGSFTFTSSDVDLAVGLLDSQGTTNPASRDKQQRNPVFVISKEFMPRGKPLRAGQSHISGIRPTDIKGISGAIPQTKVTYVDIGIMAGVPKDVCRLSLQRIYSSLSDRVLAGDQVKFDIPHVGTLCIQNHIAAVIFLPDLVEDVRGQTVRVHTNKLFANDVTRNNLKVVEGHHSLFKQKGLLPQPLKALVLSATPYFTTSTPMRRPLSQQRSQRTLQHQALKTIDNFFYKSEVQTPSRRPMTAGNKKRHASARPMTTRGGQFSHTNLLSDVDPAFLNTLLSLTSKLRFEIKNRDTFGEKKIARLQFENILFSEDMSEHAASQVALLIKLTRCEDGKEIRYQEFFQRIPAVLHQYKQHYKGTMTPNRPSVSARCSSRGFKPPSQVQVFALAIELNRRRDMLIEQLQRQGVNLRSKQTPSQMYSHLKKSGGMPHILLPTLQALLRELALSNPQLGLHSATLLELFKRTKPFIENGGRYIATFNGGEDTPLADYSQHNQAKQALDRSKVEDITNWTNRLRDLFYNEKRTLKEIFATYAKYENSSDRAGYIDQAGFIALINKYKGQLDELTTEQATALFMHASGSNLKLPYPQFEKVFKWKVPYSDWETVALHRLKHWLYANGLNAQDAYNRILSIKGGVSVNVKSIPDYRAQISRSDFTLFLKKENFNLTAPQIDILFRSLDPDGDGFIDFKKFQYKLFGESDNIAGNPLTQLRQVIITNDIKPDDVLRKMKLYVWDGPFDQTTLSKHLLLLEPQLSRENIKKIFKDLQQDGVVQLSVLMKNLCGEAFQTVDFRNKQMGQIYDYLQKKPALSHKLVSLCEKADDKNLGTLEPNKLKEVLLQLQLPIQETQIERFIRQLSKDKEGRIQYLKLIEKMETVGNRNHNPFRTVVQRIKKFLDTNRYEPGDLIRLLGGQSEGVPLDKFADFLARKVDKSRSLQQLLSLCELLDVDKDGHIDICDLQTCLGNLGSLAFFRDGGAALSYGSRRAFFPTKGFDNPQHLSAVCSTVKNAISAKRLPISEVFLQLDTNSDGLLSFTEFSQGIGRFVQLAQPVKERLFATMDLKKLGVVDYDSFVSIIDQGVFALKRRQEVNKESDNFHWQEKVIQKLREWIRRDRLTPEEAFKNFDRDFDGLVGKEDLKWGITNILGIDPLSFNDIQIDRLLTLLDHRKRGSLRFEDFSRLAGDISALQLNDSVSARPLSGGFEKPDFDWKQHSRQQIGLTISRKFPSIQSSFEDATQRRFDKVTFEQFCRFIETHHALKGFNMTKGLIRELFGELDPHKKGYLSQVDWRNAFSGFNWSRQVLEEFHSSLSGNFSDVAEAYSFFASFHSNIATQTLSFQPFAQAVNSLTSKRFKPHEVEALWKFLVGPEENSLSKSSFIRHFSSLQFTGRTATSLLGSRSSSRKFSSSVSAARSKSLISLRSPSGGLVPSTSAVWDTTGIFERLKYLVRASNKDVAEVFRAMDKDKSGKLTPLQFRNGVRKLGLGLSSRDIDNVLARLDSNADGLIDYEQFAHKLKPRESDVRIIDRTRAKVDRLKELMFRHLISPRDAFARFDTSRTGKLTYSDFNHLVNTAFKAAHQQLPSYPVLKDLFDVIDVRKDGIIDLSEWLSIFKNADQAQSLFVSSTPISSSFSTQKIVVPRKSSRPTTAGITRAFQINSDMLQQNWEETREYEAILTHIGRNRKLLAEQMGAYASGSGLVSYERAGRVLRDALLTVVGSLNENKLRILLKPGEKEGKVEYRRLLEIYKERGLQRASHPRSAWE